jgi:hypothetical protein
VLPFETNKACGDSHTPVSADYSPHHALILVELQMGRVKAEERHEITHSWMKNQVEEIAKSNT